MSSRHSGLHVWGWPIGLAMLTTFGLLSALLGQGGVWWLLSWTALAVPLVVIVNRVSPAVRRNSSSVSASATRVARE